MKWKKGFFSKASRLTLIKSVLSGIPGYYLSLFRVPSGGCKSTKKYMRLFVRGGGRGSRLPFSYLGGGGPLYDLGGLGIGNLRIHNRALSAKWLWLFHLKPNSFWHRIVVSKHDSHPFEWITRGIKGSFRNPWKIISFELPTFSRLFLVLWEMVMTPFSGRIDGWGRIPFVFLFHICIIFPCPKIVLSRIF